MEGEGMPHPQAAEVKYRFHLYLPRVPSEYFHSLISCTARKFVGLEHRAYYLDNQLLCPRTLDSLQQQLA